MNLAQMLQWDISLFLLIFSRWAGMIMLAPVFTARGVPTMIRLGLTGSITLIMYPLIAAGRPVVPLELLPFAGLLIKEGLVGLVIGFVIYAITAILQGAGQLIDFQMGFTMGNMIDPVYGMQSPLMGNFQLILATMLLLATNAHHVMIAAMVRSYAFVPINVQSLPAQIGFYMDLLTGIFSLSLQIALPVFGALVLGDIGVGLLSKTVPQLNIFSVMFSVKVIFGFVLLYLAMFFFSESVTFLFNKSLFWLNELLRGWSP